MKYEAWRKLGVVASDLRTLNIDGLDDAEVVIPGVAFMQPVIEDFRGHPRIKRFDCLGFITYDPKRLMWDVQIENTEREFIDLEVACRYLWDMHYKDELDGPRYRLIGVDESGTIITNKLCDDFRALEYHIRRELPEPPLEPGEKSYAERVIEDLSRVGNRFSEFPHGHYAAFPIDD